MIISRSTDGILTRPFANIDVKVAALVVQFIVSVTFNLTPSFLPLFISSEFDQTLIDATYWSGIVQLMSLITAITAPFWGLMCDRVGTKKILLISIAGSIIGSAGMAASTSVMHIILFRGLQGVFGAASTAIFTLIASIILEEEQLRIALSYQIAAMTIGQIAGPGIGGMFVSMIGYRLTFVASSLLCLSITPIVILLKESQVDKPQDGIQFGFSDFRAILPDFVSLILVYACINFIIPMIPWFLKSLGIPYEQLLTFTALTTVLNGVAFAGATPILARVITDKTLPILSAIAAGAIFVTSFVRDPYQFIVLRVSIGAIQAGILPSLFGGKSGRKGTSMGLLNSARFIGQAMGPFMATSILSDGTSLRVLYTFTTMMSISLFASLITYLTHTRNTSIQLR